MQVALPTIYSHMAIALSGGADSWALVLMAQEQGAQFVALTVDHKLRPESTAEAQAVAAECARRGIKHEILTWQHNGVPSRIQERARDARYALMIDYCHQHTIPALLTAHHADDQAETILQRFAHASDVGGMAGLRESGVRNGITLLRPLLHTTKQQLVNYVTQRGVPFVQDPSNTNTRYARARLRAARDVLETEGLTTENLQKFATKMAAADDALTFATHELITRHAVWENAVVLALPLEVLSNKPAALQHRALTALWRMVTGETGYAPEAETLHTALSTLATKQTFGGMVAEPCGNTLRFYREHHATEKTVIVQPCTSAVWDRRFRITNNSNNVIAVTALGNTPTAEVETIAPWATAIKPAAARATLPAVNGQPVTLEENDKSAVYAMKI